MNSIKCNNVFSNKIKPLDVSANGGHHRKATNTSKGMLHMYYMHVVMLGSTKTHRTEHNKTPSTHSTDDLL
jgi:hypothetical protein